MNPYLFRTDAHQTKAGTDRGFDAAQEEDVMVIQSRMVMGIAAVIAVGAAAWGSMFALRPTHQGTVEIKQVDSRAWAVEITELGADSVVVASQPASAAR